MYLAKIEIGMFII